MKVLVLNLCAWQLLFVVVFSCSHIFRWHLWMRQEPWEWMMFAVCMVIVAGGAATSAVWALRQNRPESVQGKS